MHPTGLGNYVVYAGNRDTFVDVLNLEELQQYEFYVYEYAANNIETIYKLPGVFTSGTTLPVSMLSFTGSVSGDHAVLSWITASESNNKGFYIVPDIADRNIAYLMQAVDHDHIIFCFACAEVCSTRT